VPRSVKIRVLFGGVMNQIGWACFAIALMELAALIYASKLEQTVVLIGGAFLLVGVILALRGLGRGLLAARLLVEGTLAGGKLVDKLYAGYEVKNRRVYDYVFEFAAADGSRHTVKARTAEDSRMEDEALEPILYDASLPYRAVVIDQLDGPPRIDPDGRIQGASVVRAAAALALPCVAVIGVAAVVAAIVLVR